MLIEFRTNIDCCKRFMLQLNANTNDSEIQPVVGDRVRVAVKPEIWLKVTSRSLVFEENMHLLICDLHLEEWETIPGLERRLRS